MTQLDIHPGDTERYANCINVSKRIRWEIEKDVIRGRQFDMRKKFLPNGLSRVNDMPFLTAEEKRFFSQVQGRTYANMFGLVERFICAKVMEVSQDHVLGDQVALEALIRFSDEELKHQELFRRLDNMAAKQLPPGYQFMPQPNDVASVVLSKSTWAVMGLTLHIELFTQAHYRESIEPDSNLSELWKDVFLFHWREESQHAILDELEWKREDTKISATARDQAVTDLIDLVVAVDGILQMQAEQDAKYFMLHCSREFSSEQAQQIQDTFLRAYRWQYIVSGVQDERFASVLFGMVTDEQAQRIATALTPLIESMQVDNAKAVA
jgi:hypothetical protein